MKTGCAWCDSGRLGLHVHNDGVMLKVKTEDSIKEKYWNGLPLGEYLGMEWFETSPPDEPSTP